MVTITINIFGKAFKEAPFTEYVEEIKRRVDKLFNSSNNSNIPSFIRSTQSESSEAILLNKIPISTTTLTKLCNDVEQKFNNTNFQTTTPLLLPEGGFELVIYKKPTEMHRGVLAMNALYHTNDAIYNYVLNRFAGCENLHCAFILGTIDTRITTYDLKQLDINNLQFPLKVVEKIQNFPFAKKVYQQNRNGTTVFCPFNIKYNLETIKLKICTQNVFESNEMVFSYKNYTRYYISINSKSMDILANNENNNVHYDRPHVTLFVMGMKEEEFEHLKAIASMTSIMCKNNIIKVEKALSELNPNHYVHLVSMDMSFRNSVMQQLSRNLGRKLETYDPRFTPHISKIISKSNLTSDDNEIILTFDTLTIGLIGDKEGTNFVEFDIITN